MDAALSLLLLTPLTLAAFTDPDERAEARAVLDALRAGLGELPAGRPVPLHCEGESRWVGMSSGGKLVEDRGGLGELRVVTEYEAFGRFEIAGGGSFTWQEDPKEIEVRDGWEAAQTLRSLELQRDTPWELLYEDARLTGQETLDGVACHVLRLTPRELCPVPGAAADAPRPGDDTWWVSVEEPRLVRAELAAPSAEATIRIELDDWRPVEGARFPHRVRTTVNGFTVENTYRTIERREAWPEGTFAPSEAVLAALTRHRDGSDAERDRAIVVEPIEARPIASVRTTLPHAQMQRGLSVLLPEVMRVVLAQGAVMDGPPLVRYWTYETDEIDIEAAIPVRAPIREEGRVKACELPAGRAAIAWHIGPYEKLGEAYERLKAYFEEQGLEPADAPWEEYWTDPGLEPDPAKWRTRVVWPVREREG